nr:cytochrome c oxidase subunit 1 [Polyrhizophydium stewartii]
MPSVEALREQEADALSAQATVEWVTPDGLITPSLLDGPFTRDQQQLPDRTSQAAQSNHCIGSAGASRKLESTGGLQVSFALEDSRSSALQTPRAPRSPSARSRSSSPQHRSSYGRQSGSPVGGSRSKLTKSADGRSLSRSLNSSASKVAQSRPESVSRDGYVDAARQQTTASSSMLAQDGAEDDDDGDDDDEANMSSAYVRTNDDGGNSDEGDGSEGMSVRLELPEDMAGADHEAGSSPKQRSGLRSPAKTTSSERLPSAGKTLSLGLPSSTAKPKLWRMIKKTINKQVVLKMMRPEDDRRSARSSPQRVGAASPNRSDMLSPGVGHDLRPGSTRAARSRTPSAHKRRSGSQGVLADSQLALEVRVDPAQYYAHQRRKSGAGLGLSLSSEQASTATARPSIGIIVNIQNVDAPSAGVGNPASGDKRNAAEHGEAMEGEDPGDMEQESSLLTSRKLLLHALQTNGYIRGVGQSLYQVVHDIERRKTGMNAVERARYPTFDDPGPPLDASGTPILTADGSEVKGPSLDEISAEVERLNAVIQASTVPIPANLRKRAILLSRLGKFTQAMDDLDKAIIYDQFNSDAYWHRHQLYLRHNDVESALQDLDSITDNNKMHFGAFQTKARIYQALGIIKLAIVNYSAVIRLKPEDADGYYNRACLFEAENELVYANEDFRMVRLLDPTNEHAIYNQAIYSFQKQLWEDAIQAFSKLIIINPENAQAFMFRGRAYASIAKYEEALDASIGLNRTRLCCILLTQNAHFAM